MFKQIKEFVCSKIDKNVTNDVFDYYKKNEQYPNRYQSFSQQYTNKELLCKSKFNWFAFLFPTFYLARIKFIYPIYIIMVSLIVIFYLYATLYWSDPLRQSSFLVYYIDIFILAIPIRFIVGFYGDFIENILLVKRLNPIVTFLKKTEQNNKDKILEILTRANWFRVIIAVTIIEIPIIIVILMNYFHVRF